MSVDVLAIGAHPDDVEMTVGGTLAKLADRGRSVAIVDMTRGEMGSNGTAEQRDEESAAAAKVLGVAQRINLDLGDGLLVNTIANRTRVIEVIRDLRPTIVLANYWEDLHADHTATGEIVRDIMYTVGFRNFPAVGEAHRPNEFLYYMSHFPFQPSFIVDISDYHETKIESVRCYASQLHPESGGGDGGTGGGKGGRAPTNIARPEFLDILEGRARYFGQQILRRFGEPLLAPRPVPMDDPLDHYQPFTKI